LLSLTKVSSLGSPSAKSPYAHSAIEYIESPIALGKLGKAGGAASSGLWSKNLQRIQHLGSEARVRGIDFERHDPARFSDPPSSHVVVRKHRSRVRGWLRRQRDMSAIRLKNQRLTQLFQCSNVPLSLEKLKRPIAIKVLTL